MEERMAAYRRWYDAQRADELANPEGCIPSEPCICPPRGTEAETPILSGSGGTGPPLLMRQTRGKPRKGATMFQLQVLKGRYCWYFAGRYETGEDAHRAASLFHPDDPFYAIYPVALLEEADDARRAAWPKAA